MQNALTWFMACALQLSCEWHYLVWVAEGWGLGEVRVDCPQPEAEVQ